MISLTIDNESVTVPDNTTVLEAAQLHGIEIPTLCAHKDLSPYGGCRLCVVDVKGEASLLASCTLQATEGMHVKTNSRKVRRYRRLLLQLLLSEYHDDGYPTGTRDGDQNELYYWAKKYRVSRRKYQKPAAELPIDADPNPFIWVDMNKCIYCTRCVRACAEIQGRFVWTIAGRGYRERIVAGADTDLITARCESCGACVAYCPTGALENKLSMSNGHPDKVVTTTCTYCGVGCQLNLEVKDNHIQRVTSQADGGVNGMHLCVKGRYGYDFVHHPDRLTQPQVRRYLLENKPRPAPSDRGEWVAVEWDVALDLAAQKLTEIRSQSGGDAVGILTSAKCTNEENYLMNKFARQVIGTNNIDHCARL